MKFAISLLFLLMTACAAPQTPRSTTPAPACPSCPSCPTATCPEQSCPACPAPTPAPQPPAWYCHDLKRPKVPVSGFCRPSLASCEKNRAATGRLKQSKPGPCVVQQTAHCFQIADDTNMSRQFMCAQTAENCARRREWVKQNKLHPDDQISQCGEVANTDGYYPREDEPLNPAADATP